MHPMNTALSAFELKPALNAQKSYYKKAKIWKIGNSIILYSYGNSVCRINGDGTINVESLYRSSTVRHIKDFLFQFSKYIDAVKYRELMLSGFDIKELEKIKNNK